MARNPKYIDGLDDVTRALSRFTDKAPVKLVQALNKSAGEIADRARILAPVDDADTRDSIGNGIDTTGRGGKSVAAIVYAGGGGSTGAWRSEFGRAPGGEGINADHPGHVAQPFMFPAYHSIRKRVRGRVTRALNALAKEIARNGRG
jgi:HK97 gp10 family phage protein